MAGPSHDLILPPLSAGDQSPTSKELLRIRTATLTAAIVAATLTAAPSAAAPVPTKSRPVGCNTMPCEARVKARMMAERYGGCRSMVCVQRVRERILDRARGAVIGTFTATAYGPPWGGINGGGITANGTNLRGGPAIYGIAADPRVLKMGLRVKVWPNPFRHRGVFRVFDTGGAIKGRRLDFYDWRGRRAQLAWGRRTVTVFAVR